MPDNNSQLLSTVSSIAASVVLARTLTNELIPYDFRSYFQWVVDYVSHKFSNEFTTIVEEYQGRSKNQVFEAAQIYLNSKAKFSTDRVKVRKSEDEKSISFYVDRDEEIFDDFGTIRVKWKLIRIPVDASRIQHHDDDNSSPVPEIRSYELKFHKKHKEMIFNSYLPYIMERSEAIKHQNKAPKIHQAGQYYQSVKFNHPMTFKTLAIDAEIKREILNDLDKFVKGKEFYKRTGKSWKRGYLLYGPPGTGKSSLIAAMANYLNYDIYDLDLTSVYNNTDLRDILLRMNNRSILVIEDIDCSIHLQNREKDEDEEVVDNGENKVTLSGLLNVIDGLWSCCREECIIVVTTNHKERLDSALLRPGRMDMQIHLSYCTFSIFEQLVNNYLGITEHKVFEEIKGLLKEVQVTPAEIAEELIKIVDSKEGPQDIVKFVKNKKMLKDETKSEEDFEEGHEKDTKNLG